MIACTENCIYQNGGVCHLERAGSIGTVPGQCANFVERRSKTAQSKSKQDGTESCSPNL
jgi:hypothetical protein